MIPHCLGQNIRGPWFKVTRPTASVALGLALLFLAAFAQEPGSTLGEAVRALESGDPAQALRLLDRERKANALLADYLAYWSAAAHFQLQNNNAAVDALEPLWRMQTPSPLAGRGALIAARASLAAGDAVKALNWLNRYSELLPQPQGALLRGKAYEQAGELRAAAAAYQAVYYGYPATQEAEEAADALKELATRLGTLPGVAAPPRFERAEKLAAAKLWSAAKREYMEIASVFRDLARDQARVRIGALDHQAGKSQAALRYLEDLRVDNGLAEAERLYWLAAAYRRLERASDLDRVLRELEERHTRSEWRQKANQLAGAMYLVENEPSKYVPFYQACKDAMPESADAALCHWKVVWRAWLDRKPDAAAQLRTHLTDHPGSPHASAALYFLGRSSESANDRPAARRYYREILTRFPNSYYAMTAREQLRRSEIAAAGPSEPVDEYLKTVKFPERVPEAEFQMNAASRNAIERARALERAGLDSWAEGELRFRIRQGGQPYVLAMELSEMAIRRGEHDVALRLFKATANGYLYMPREAAPERFWKLAFPLPYRNMLTAHARSQELDPFLLAGLIRQESEFNPRAVSRAKAVGLTQVMPSTGRQLSRRIGIRGFRTSMLTQPEINLRLGSYHFRNLLDSLNGNVEATLAAYNAGKSRADRWLTWGTFREPAEFIETIPFTETRDYVQIVLRNAQTYRELYAKEPAPAAVSSSAASTAPLSSGVGKPKPAAQKKPAAASKRKPGAAKPSVRPK